MDNSSQQHKSFFVDQSGHSDLHQHYFHHVTVPATKPSSSFLDHCSSVSSAGQVNHDVYNHLYNPLYSSWSCHVPLASSRLSQDPSYDAGVKEPSSSEVTHRMLNEDLIADSASSQDNYFSRHPALVESPSLPLHFQSSVAADMPGFGHHYSAYSPFGTNSDNSPLSHHQADINVNDILPSDSLQTSGLPNCSKDESEIRLGSGTEYNWSAIFSNSVWDPATNSHHFTPVLPSCCSASDVPSISTYASVLSMSNHLPLETRLSSMSSSINECTSKSSSHELASSSPVASCSCLLPPQSVALTRPNSDPWLDTSHSIPAQSASPTTHPWRASYSDAAKAHAQMATCSSQQKQHLNTQNDRQGQGGKKSCCNLNTASSSSFGNRARCVKSGLSKVQQAEANCGPSSMYDLDPVDEPIGYVRSAKQNRVEDIGSGSTVAESLAEKSDLTSSPSVDSNMPELVSDNVAHFTSHPLGQDQACEVTDKGRTVRSNKPEILSGSRPADKSTDASNTGDTSHKRKPAKPPASKAPVCESKDKIFFDPRRIFASKKDTSLTAGVTGKTDCARTVKSSTGDFFDPQKIFASSSTPGHSTTSEPKVLGTGSNENSSPDEGSDMYHSGLNNDKPTKSSSATLTANLDRANYINNKLREDNLSSPSHTSGIPLSTDAGLPPWKNSESHTHRVRSSSATRRRSARGHRSSDHTTRRDDTHSTRNEEVHRKHQYFWQRIDWTEQRRILEHAARDGLNIVWNVVKIVIGMIIFELFTFIKWSFQYLSRLVNWLLMKTGLRRQQETGPNFWQRSSKKHYLTENIELPATGDEAMRRLFACKGKDPYSILGLKVDCSDEDIRKYYRRQAVLVHPDKNHEPGAEEAFKILNHAFEMIGETEKRKQYDLEAAKDHVTDAAMQEFSDLLTKLHETMKETINMMACSYCGGKHRRYPVDVWVGAARYCARCNVRHPAKEGDVWAESSVLGFRWHYFACMDGDVYDITEWVSCQKDDFKHLKANSHFVMLHIATGGKHHHRTTEADLEGLFSSMFASAADGFAGPLFNQSGKPPAKPPPAPAGRRRRKKRH